MITMILGDGGVGKSTVALDILARITRGEAWPTLGDDEETYAPEGNVVVLTKEEDIGMIVKPRLAAAGAVLDRVHTFGYEVPDDATEFDIIGRLDEKVREIERLILEIGHVRAILIDPITDFLGKRDINSAPEVRALLTPLLQLAVRHKIAVINIMHLNN